MSPEEIVEPHSDADLAQSGLPRPSVLVRSVCALVTGGAAVAATWGVGELVASFNAQWQSPIISVGNRVVDWVPPAIKSAAIDAFGKNDKTALIVGTVVILFGLAVWAAARVIRWNWWQAVGFVMALALVGMASATLGREGSATGFIPTLAAALAALGVYWIADTALSGEDSPPTAPIASQRRVVLVASMGAVMGGSAAMTKLARSRRATSTAVVRRSKLSVPAADRPLPAEPADPAQRSELAGLTPLYMPNDRFYRIDTSLFPPEIDVSDWSLTVMGMVDREMTYSYDDIINRPLFEADTTIACVSNEVGADLVGNARWLGCRLDDLLDEAGIRLAADQVVGWSADGWSGGFPVEVLDGRDAMVAVAMNGELLSAPHGFPARLIVPGVYGYVSATKWLTRIELTRFEDFRGYWIDRGWSQRAPIKTQSRIDRPRSGGRVSAGVYSIAGVAWAPIDGVAQVEVQVDEGEWRVATLGPDIGRASWRQWWVEWDASAGDHTIRVRATNGKGETQTSELAPVEPDGATGWHTVTLSVG